MDTDIVFISSVIGVSGAPLTYTKVRSVFTAEERYDQTVKTIESVRKYVPGAKILLVETSELSTVQQEGIRSKVDYFINTFDDPVSKSICIDSPKKGFGEAIQTKVALTFLLVNNIQFRRFFKLSGRYALTEKYNRDAYSDNEYTFYNPSVENPSSISTVVYSVPYVLLNHFAMVVDRTIEVYNNVSAIGLEELLPLMCLPRKHIDRIGVEGLVSVNGGYFTC
jgi:hypothetical protein